MYKKALLVVVSGVCLFAASTRTFVGVITEGPCSKDNKNSCGAECPESGYQFVLAVKTKVYKLCDQASSAKFSGKKVKVLGTLAGDIISVISMEAAK